MKVMYWLYDSPGFYDFTWRFLRQRCTDSTILPILRFYVRIFPIIIHRFYDSSDSTILPEDGYERDVTILRFLRFYDFTLGFFR